VGGHSLASNLKWNEERLFQLDPKIYLDTGEFVHLLIGPLLMDPIQFWFGFDAELSSLQFAVIAKDITGNPIGEVR
jgi:hypothetical protein